MCRHFLIMLSLVFSVNLASALRGGADLNRSRLIAAVVIVNGGIEVWINTRAHWNQEHSLIDSYPAGVAKSVDRITEKISLCNLQESVYEPCRPGRSVEQIKAGLAMVGVANDLKFQKWAEHEISGH